MGADLSADGDREIRFLSDGMTPPLTDRLVVCGAAPNVNGFLGVTGDVATGLLRLVEFRF